MTGKLILFSILFAGSLALLPMIAFLEINPLPGDVTVNLANHHIFLPFIHSPLSPASFWRFSFSFARK